MRSATSAGLIALAVLVLWAAITGRLSCLSTAFTCVVNGAGAAPAAGGGTSPAGARGGLPALPALPDASGVLRNLLPRGWTP